MEGGTATGCTISGNEATDGGGLSSATATNCIISGNTATRDGGGTHYGTAINCVISSNTAGSYGGGAYWTTVGNGTIVDNTADSYGGGTYAGTLVNTIVYYNTAVVAGNNVDGGSATYCCSPDLTSGTGNITNAPAFVDRAAGNVHLLDDSPCINAGNNAAVNAATDLDGNPRIVGIVDMGAYESPAVGPTFLPLVLSGQNLDLFWVEAGSGTIFVEAASNLIDAVWVEVTNVTSVVVGHTNSVSIPLTDSKHRCFRIVEEQ
jgi:hypothetical protein